MGEDQKNFFLNVHRPTRLSVSQIIKMFSESSVDPFTVFSCRCAGVYDIFLIVCTALQCARQKGSMAASSSSSQRSMPFNLLCTYASFPEEKKGEKGKGRRDQIVRYFPPSLSTRRDILYAINTSFICLH